MTGMSDQGTPQNPQDWQKLWQDQLRHEDPYAEGHASGSYGLHYRYAGGWSRVLATFIDSFLILLFEALVFAGVWVMGMGDALLIASAAGFAPYLWFQWLNGSRGQTPGKRVLHLKVVDQVDGFPIGGQMGLVRWFVGWVISVFTCGIGGLVDLLWPIFDSKKQTLHDKIVGSVVLGGQYPQR